MSRFLFLHGNSATDDNVPIYVMRLQPLKCLYRIIIFQRYQKKQNRLDIISKRKRTLARSLFCLIRRNGAQDRTRTGTEFPPKDFKSFASAIPPLGQFDFGGTTRNRTGDKGFAGLCLTAWLWCLIWSGRRDSNSRHLPWQGNALPLSHFRIWWEL